MTLKYAKLIENNHYSVALGDNEEYFKKLGYELLDVSKSDKDGQWYLSSECPAKTEEEKVQEEKERIAMLKMTPRDFLLAVVDMGVDYSKIKELMASNPQVEIELQYCNNVYRGNPLLDQLCGNFGVTAEQLDELFKAKGS